MPCIAPLAPKRKYRAAALDVGDVADLPVGFDPERFPIIARHVFGIDPTNSIGRAAASLVADPHFRNKMVVLLAMGDRPPTEMIAELAVRHNLEAELDRLLDRYLALDVGALDATGARDFPPLPLYEVHE